MADNVLLNAPTSSGQTVSTEDIGAGLELPRGKIVTGAHGVDGGDVSVTNPLFVELSDGTNGLGSSTHPVRTDPTGTTTQPVSGTVGVSGTVTVAGAVVVTDSVPLTVAGTVTANVGTTGGLALDATLTGGTAKVQVTDGASHTLPTGDAVARKILVGVTDGTNGPATVKAASTAVAATDLPVAVGLHPTSPLPAGTNALGSVTVTGTTAVSGTVTVVDSVALHTTADQGTAAALGGAWPVKVTDGTNTMPTGDAVARSLAVQVNDGTNVLGTTAHPVQTAITDGTHALPTGDASARAIHVTTDATAGAPLPVQLSQGNAVLTTSNAIPVVLTDNAGHTMPSGDAAARAGFEKITDGTNTAAVKAASTAAVATDPALVVSLSPNSPVSYPARSNSIALAAVTSVVKASAGNLMSLKIRNRNTSARYAMLFNQTTTPTNGTSALDVFLLPPQSMAIFGTDYFSESGIALSTGIAIAISSADAATLTLATASDHDISAVFT